MNERDAVCECETIHAEAVSNARKRMPEDEALYTLSDFFKVFGDSTRVRILWALDAGELCVCDLAVLLGMTRSAISHQLHSLRDADLVRFRREGKIVYYALSDDHVKDILEKGFEHINEKENRK